MYDMTNIRGMGTLATHAPEAMNAFTAFDRAALAEGAIPVKYKELMALAVAFTTQCPYCIRDHTAQAFAEGTSKEEIMEAVCVAAELHACAPFAHADSVANEMENVK